MNKTNNYKLNLPSGSDVIDVGVLDENFEIIDNSLTGLDSKIRSNLDLVLQVIEKVTVTVNIQEYRLGDEESGEFTEHAKITDVAGKWSSGRDFNYRIDIGEATDFGAGLSMYLYAYLDASTIVVGVDNEPPANAVFIEGVGAETITFDLAKLKSA